MCMDAEQKRKKISVVVPCYNEEKTVNEVYNRLIRLFDNELSAYDFEIIYADDYSSDNTRVEIEALCRKDKRVKAIFNARNFGFHRNVFQSYQYASGDCAFMMFGDLQDPPEMLPEFVRKWEEGYKCIVGQRETSEEGSFKNGLRKLYYKVINMLSESRQLELINGFGLYDRDFLDVLKEIDDTVPFFKAVLNEYGIDLCVVKDKHQASKRGKSNFNFWKNYDFAMHGLTSSTKLLMRLATFISVLTGTFCLIYTAYVFIRKLLFWDTYPLGSASIMIGVFLLGSMQLFFIGILGEYILSINERVCRKPRVVVEKRINFEERKSDGKSGAKQNQ